MNPEPTPADIRASIVDALVHATMPDGSPISSRVKAETIVSQLGITDCPTELLHLIAAGIGNKTRDARSRAVRRNCPPQQEARAPAKTETRRDMRDRKRGPERVSLSHTAGFTLGDSVRITMRNRGPS